MYINHRAHNDSQFKLVSRLPPSLPSLTSQLTNSLNICDCETMKYKCAAHGISHVCTHTHTYTWRCTIIQ